VDQNEKRRDLSSRALGEQIPNPGSVPRLALDTKFSMFRLVLVLLGVILQRCHCTRGR
jgi:hypothetical protein